MDNSLRSSQRPEILDQTTKPLQLMSLPNSRRDSGCWCSQMKESVQSRTSGGVPFVRGSLLSPTISTQYDRADQQADQGLASPLPHRQTEQLSVSVPLKASTENQTSSPQEERWAGAARLISNNHITFQMQSITQFYIMVTINAKEICAPFHSHICERKS